MSSKPITLATLKQALPKGWVIFEAKPFQNDWCVHAWSQLEAGFWIYNRRRQTARRMALGALKALKEARRG